MNRSSTSRAQPAKAKVEIVANTRNAIVAQIVIRWPTSTVTSVFFAAAALADVVLSGMPATWSATAAATASTSVMIARKGRLRDAGVATAQRYREAPWPQYETSAPDHAGLLGHARAVWRGHGEANRLS